MSAWESWESLDKDKKATDDSKYGSTNRDNESNSSDQNASNEPKIKNNVKRMDGTSGSIKILNKNSTNKTKNIQITFEDNTRSQFIPQQQQQQQNQKVQILRRPQANNTKADNLNFSAKDNVGNIKTIQERKAAYAEARERILGKDYENNDEDELVKRVDPLNQQSSRRDDNLIRQPNAPNLNANFARKQL